MTQTESKPPLLTFAFVGLCALIFLTYCNITVFYNLYVYMGELGIDGRWRGFLIGCSSLATIIFFVLFSAAMTARNAARNAYLGAGVLLACGFAYLGVSGAGGMLAVRLLNGVGVYLLTASSMILLVSTIPAERSGQAFGIYSVAILLPYSIVPTVFDHLSPLLPNLAWGYTIMALALLPAVAVVTVIDRRMRRDAPAASGEAVTYADMLTNARQPRIAMVLLLNALYIVTFSSLFFLAKGLFLDRGLPTLGYFFSIQMVVMIVLRLLVNQLFDSVRKITLIRVTFALTGASFVLIALAHSLHVFYAAALLLGLGMGFGSPALYSLMFKMSPPRYKGVNSNLMILSLQLGNFFGPLLGGAVVNHGGGYTGFVLADVLVCLLGFGLCSVLTARRVDPDGSIAAF